MPRFAANLGYLFTDRPLIERIDAAAACGFKGVELHFPYDVPAPAVKAAIDRNRLTVLGINTPPGERDGEFGLAAVPGREQDFQAAFTRALDYSAAIGGSAVHCLAGKVAPEQRPAAERVFIGNLTWAADLAAAKNIMLLIEPINARDRPNYFLNRVEHAADIIGKVGKPNVRIQFDFYHAQIVGGDLIHRLETIHAGDRPSAMRGGARPARAGRGRGQLPAIFEAVDRSATAAGSAPNTGRAGAPRTAWAGQGPMACVPALTPINHKALEKPRFSALRAARRVAKLTPCGDAARKPSPTAPATPNALKDAVREARIEAAERSAVVVDLRDAEVARLELLNEALDPLFKDIPDRRRAVRPRRQQGRRAAAVDRRRSRMSRWAATSGNTVSCRTPATAARCWRNPTRLPRWCRRSPATWRAG